MDLKYFEKFGSNIRIGQVLDILTLAKRMYEKETGNSWDAAKDVAAEPYVYRAAAELIQFKGEVMSNIAARHLNIDTFKVQNSDRLDFHEVHVENLKNALIEAYARGRQDEALARQ